MDGLSELELAEYNALKFEFETLVGDRLTSGYEYSDIVKEYNESLITDVDNEWKDLKAYGFKLRTEVLGTMDYTNIDNYDSDFGEATIELANKLLRPENSDEEYLYGNLVTSDFGVHKIKGIRNDDGVLPTAFYEETDPENPAFTVGNENDSVIPNQTQIDLFNQMKLEEFIGEDKEIYMPDSVFDALLYLYEDVFSQYVSAWGSNLMNLEEVLTGNITFAENSAANVTLIQMQKDTLLDEELIPWIYKD